MTKLSDDQAASLALLTVYAMDMYLSDRSSLAPAVDSRLKDNWIIRGYLTGTDALLRRGRTVAFGSDVCYGYLAEMIEKPGTFVVAIRGTDGILEWIEDAQFVPINHPVTGKVEYGFYSIYQTLTYRPVVGEASNAVQGLTAAVGTGELIVLGHSLGSTLATYLTFDLADIDKLGVRVQGCYFASPRPGNAVFVQAFAARVAAYNLYNYELDVVPRVPFGPDYTDLPNCNWIGVTSARARIGFSLDCHHHLLCYCAMLKYDLLNWKSVPAIDAAYVLCIKGPMA